MLLNIDVDSDAIDFLLLIVFRLIRTSYFHFSSASSYFLAVTTGTDCGWGCWRIFWTVLIIIATSSKNRFISGWVDWATSDWVTSAWAATSDCTNSGWLTSDWPTSDWVTPAWENAGWLTAGWATLDWKNTG